MATVRAASTAYEVPKVTDNCHEEIGDLGSSVDIIDSGKYKH